jgi:hypothetical protein
MDTHKLVKVSLDIQKITSSAVAVNPKYEPCVFDVKEKKAHANLQDLVRSMPLFPDDASAHNAAGSLHVSTPSGAAPILYLPHHLSFA